ncbi:MAG: hypothetical protein RIS47_2194, partial [Bacteroidota bacterium]
SEISLNTAQKMVEEGDKLTSKLSKMINMIDIRNMSFIGSDARKYLATVERINLKANVIILNSKIQESLFNLYIRFANPGVKTIAFSDYQSALAWSQTYLDAY